MPSFEFEVEYAKSGRAACKQCKGKIEQGALRLGIKQAAANVDSEDAAARQMAHTAEATKWHHVDCFPKIRGAPWFKKNLPDASACRGFDALTSDDQEKVKAVYAQCVGATPAVENATPQKGAKRKAAEAEGSAQKAAKVAETGAASAQGMLTDEQYKSLETARMELQKKNGAALSALLAKNGLPKSGKKDELVERAAECKVLGVPPACPTCQKAKLKWARDTGLFSCPGFFCEEAKRFKKCKGPSKDADQSFVRTAWQELC